MDVYDRPLTIDQLLDQLKEQPEAIARLTADLPRGRLHHAPRPGEWSANDVLAHLKEEQEYGETHPAFLAPLAPDSFHKEDVSGGAPYEIALPNPACDADVLNMERSFTFVAYLRHAFSWAGLPGYAEVFSRPPPEIVAIAAQLEPL